MKLKKKPKIILTIILILAIALASFFVVTKYLFKDKEPAPIKVLKTIDTYGYQLKENKTKKYKDYFKELETILLSEEVDDESYVKKISEMFIYDFYSLDDKTTKTDVGGVDFVHKEALENFLKNAEDTYYKYVESNLYGERKQQLPIVDQITITSITPTEYAYLNKKNAGYEVKLNWTYTDAKYASYQSTATLTFVKEDKIFYLVELQK